MKTTKKTTLLKKLEALTKREIMPLSKSSKAYIFTLQIIEGAKTIRPCYTSGRGRFTTNLDYSNHLQGVLIALRIEYALSNDAVLGSPTGNLITVKTKIKL